MESHLKGKSRGVGSHVIATTHANKYLVHQFKGRKFGWHEGADLGENLHHSHLDQIRCLATLKF